MKDITQMERIVYYGITLPIIFLSLMLIVLWAKDLRKKHLRYKHIEPEDWKYVSKYEFLIPVSFGLVLLISYFFICLAFEYRIKI